MTDRARPGLVALYDIRPGNGAGQFLQPHSPHGADQQRGSYTSPKYPSISSQRRCLVSAKFCWGMNGNALKLVLAWTEIKHSCIQCFKGRVEHIFILCII